MTLIIPEGIGTGRDMETERRHCAHCRTAFRVNPDDWNNGALRAHEKACADRTEEERAFYREHRRFPHRRSA